MKDKIKSIMSRMVFLGITGALLMGGSSSCNKDKDKHNQPPASKSVAVIPIPAGYSTNDYTQVYNYFKQKSEGRTNEDIFKQFNNDFDIKNPNTWHYNNINNGTINFNKDGRLEQFDLQNNDLFKGDLDLTGCDELKNINLLGTNITSIRIPKKSTAGLGAWIFENASDTQMDSIITAMKNNKSTELDKILDQLKANAKVPSAGEIQLVRIERILSAFRDKMGYEKTSIYKTILVD